jgi:hypothetical protein
MGFLECARLARSRVVFLANDFDVGAEFWLFDYIPELILADRHIFPNRERFAAAFGSIGREPPRGKQPQFSTNVGPCGCYRVLRFVFAGRYG